MNVYDVVKLHQDGRLFSHPLLIKNDVFFQLSRFPQDVPCGFLYFSAVKDTIERILVDKDDIVKLKNLFPHEFI